MMRGMGNMTLWAVFSTLLKTDVSRVQILCSVGVQMARQRTYRDAMQCPRFSNVLDYH